MEDRLAPGLSSAKERCTLEFVPQVVVPNAWPLVEHWIEEAAAESRGKITAADILEVLMAGHMHLWLIRDEGIVTAVIVTEFLRFPRKKLCGIVIMVGEGKDKWLFLKDTIEKWAWMQGCKGMRHIARKGWARVLTDYDWTHVVLEKDLEDFNA